MKEDFNEILKTLEQSSEISAYDYQTQATERLLSGSNVILRVPTGCGKTWTAVIPFILNGKWQAAPHTIIYVLPVRTLIDSVAANLREKLPKLKGWGKQDIRIQTGVVSEAPFLSDSRIVVTTFDQVLSGLLGNPYGLGPSLHNINSAAILGSLIVFDEFHLMSPPDKAFLTALAGTSILRDFCQTIWMTATATDPLCDLITKTLSAEVIELSARDKSRISALSAKKGITLYDEPLSPTHILSLKGKKLIVVNQVKRAQELYIQVTKETGNSIPAVCLHSRFFDSDRATLQQKVHDLLRRDSSADEAIVIATQVVEVGLDISADHLLTEICPANALIQRAGRCARYGGYGNIHVFKCPEEEYSWLPYGNLKEEDETLGKTWQCLEDIAELDFNIARDIVNKVHSEEDSRICAEGIVDERKTEVLSKILHNNFLKCREPLDQYIRDADLSVRVIIDDDLQTQPFEREGIRFDFNVLRSFLKKHPDCDGWYWSYDNQDTSGKWEKITSDRVTCYHLMISPKSADYNPNYGLILGKPGNIRSPIAIPIPRPGYAPLGAELWRDHANKVAEYAIRRFEQICGHNSLLAEGMAGKYKADLAMLKDAVEFTAKAHDLGKLQIGWQEWAREIEKKNNGNNFLYPLAHTSGRGHTDKPKPCHALPGAYFAFKLLANIQPNWTYELRLAAIYAIASHHGGSFSDGRSIQPLCPEAQAEIREVFGAELSDCPDENEFRGFAEHLKSVLKDADQLLARWPILSLMVRILRLSDQTATGEGGENSD